MKPTSQITFRLLKDVNIVLIAKDYSLNSIKLISCCQSLGIKVGLDLFDDYFSDKRLSALTDLQNWLKLASNMSNFIICSTNRMEQVSHQFMRHHLVHRINDTRDPNLLIEETRRLMSQKKDLYKRTGRINILWFGIGDNPIFDIGIKNLSNYSNALFQLRKSFEHLKFTILTNERSLSTENLISISNLPIDANLKVWDEKAEHALLRESNIAFLPVSHQKFSIAKSTNRCLTALTYGCQVLSNGFNLYSDFSKFIYESTDDLVKDFKTTKLKFNQISLRDFAQVCDSTYNPVVEASNFIQFIKKNVMNSNSVVPSKLISIEFKDKKDSLDEQFSKNQFPIADGCQLARLDSCNFGIEIFESHVYLEFTNDCERFLLEKWRPFLQKFLLDGSTSAYRLKITKLEEMAPHTLSHTKKIIAYRFRSKASTQAKDNIRTRVMYSFIDESFRQVLNTLFGHAHIYLSNYPHYHKVVGREL